MDPIAIAKSALGVLKEAKAQLEKCKAAKEEARELLKDITVFEVTLMMIPTRTPEEATTASPPTDNPAASLPPDNSSPVPGVQKAVGLLTVGVNMARSGELISGNALQMSDNPIHSTQAGKAIAESGSVAAVVAAVGAASEKNEEVARKNPKAAHAAAVLKEGLKDAAQTAINNGLVQSGIGDVSDFFSLCKDDGPIIDLKAPQPAELMRDMKMKKENSYRVYSDLDVMNVGMAFIIKMCLETIGNATGTVANMDAVGPIALWDCIPLPWRVAAILKLRGALEGHKDSLSKKVQSLQSAIGVASYAVQLESLESALDSSSVIKHRDMRVLWKKKIGADKTKVTMAEFCEAFFSTVDTEKDEAGFIEERMKYVTPAKNRNKDEKWGWIKEKINRSTNSAEVLLSRFLAEIFNSNNDNDLSVYELVKEIEEKLKCAPGGSALKATAKSILSKEEKFMSKLHFKQFKMVEPASKGADNVKAATTEGGTPAASTEGGAVESAAGSASAPPAATVSASPPALNEVVDVQSSERGAICKAMITKVGKKGKMVDIEYYDGSTENGVDIKRLTRKNAAVAVVAKEAKIVVDALEPCEIKPFRRALLLADIPCMNQEFYGYDALVMLRHDKDPEKVLKSKTKLCEFDMKECADTKVFTRKRTNIEYWKNKYYVDVGKHGLWSAFPTHKTPNKKSGRKFLEGFRKAVNWELQGSNAVDDDDDKEPEVAAAAAATDHKKEPEVAAAAAATDMGAAKPQAVPEIKEKAVAAEEEGAEEEAGGEEEEDGWQVYRILYTPLLTKPGLYSPRLCIDTYVENDDGEMNTNQMSKSAKSFYKGNCKQMLEIRETRQKAEEKTEEEKKGAAAAHPAAAPAAVEAKNPSKRPSVGDDTGARATGVRKPSLTTAPKIFDEMGVKELKTAIADEAGLSSHAAGFTEKHEFVNLLKTATAAKAQPEGTTHKRASLKGGTRTTQVDVAGVATTEGAKKPEEKKEKKDFGFDERERSFVHSMLGPSVRVIDDLEIVWGEEATWENCRQGAESDDEETDPKKKKMHWYPYLERDFPYEPVREVSFNPQKFVDKEQEEAEERDDEQPQKGKEEKEESKDGIRFSVFVHVPKKLQKDLPVPKEIAVFIDKAYVKKSEKGQAVDSTPFPHHCCIEGTNIKLKERDERGCIEFFISKATISKGFKACFNKSVEGNEFKTLNCRLLVGFVSAPEAARKIEPIKRLLGDSPLVKITLDANQKETDSDEDMSEDENLYDDDDVDSNADPEEVKTTAKKLLEYIADAGKKHRDMWVHNHDYNDDSDNAEERGPHKLKVFKKPRNDSELNCDICGRGDISKEPLYMSCEKCDYDLCCMCAMRQLVDVLEGSGTSTFVEEDIEKDMFGPIGSERGTSTFVEEVSRMDLTDTSEFVGKTASGDY